MKPCEAINCKTMTARKQFCDKHYKRMVRHGDTEKTLIGERKYCCGVGCGRIATSRLKTDTPTCSKHYQRLRRLGSIDAKVKPQGGSRWVTKHGYVETLVNGKIAKEHRYVMSQHLGRELLPNETVHHKNGIRSDNRLENLELWASSHPSGQRVADLYSWAETIIATYKDEYEKIVGN